MNEIQPIYQNDFGIAFQWKHDKPQKTKKVQLIFRDIGLLLTPNEIQYFSKCINETLQSGNGKLCEDCKVKGECRSLLLNSPAHQITFAVSFHEVLEIKDLIKGTLFKLQLDSFFDEMGID
ncbi:hypothetical protein [uncultured Maribacter sp.]|uniref:hypothetical protein n=1 Tax=uncultured Maribacter sp. TaxID=431308 RepID=UPI0030DAFF4B|tara:strand:- start:150 stop:512 length:363 start_codon:yes stop_codon:yes gene_type:complete